MKKEINSQHASIFFVDIVGFSKKSLEKQLKEINLIEGWVRKCNIFKEKKQEIVYIPTGDGFAIVFLQSPDGPLLLAKRFTKNFKNKVRIGLHSGSIILRSNLLEQKNVVGEGINKAKRVMDCGGNAHILASVDYYRMVGNQECYKHLFHPIGNYPIKHGEELELYNIYCEKETVGNKIPPKKKSLLTIVVGDRRENPPETPGDFFAHTSSTRDLTWIFSLGLPQSTILWNDKIISATQTDNEIPDALKIRHLLIIGSPFCNLMARKVNQSTFFRFNINNEVIREIDTEERGFRGLDRNQNELRQKFNDLSNRHDELVMKLRGLGFIDPIRQQENVGAFTGQDNDYATISFCEHPYSKNHYAILIAGLHLPGTMAAVKTLAEPEFFTDRPVGGIIKISIPIGNWYERLTRSDVEWFTPAYTIESLMERFNNKSTDLFRRGVYQDNDSQKYTELLNLNNHISLQDFLLFCIRKD